MKDAKQLKAALRKTGVQLVYRPGMNRRSNYIVNRFTGESIHFGLLKWLDEKEFDRIVKELLVEDLQAAHEDNVRELARLHEDMLWSLERKQYDFAGTLSDAQKLQRRISLYLQAEQDGELAA